MGLSIVSIITLMTILIKYSTLDNYLGIYAMLVFMCWPVIVCCLTPLYYLLILGLMCIINKCITCCNKRHVTINRDDINLNILPTPISTISPIYTKEENEDKPPSYISLYTHF